MAVINNWISGHIHLKIQKSSCRKKPFGILPFFRDWRLPKFLNQALPEHKHHQAASECWATILGAGYRQTLLAATSSSSICLHAEIMAWVTLSALLPLVSTSFLARLFNLRAASERFTAVGRLHTDQNSFELNMSGIGIIYQLMQIDRPAEPCKVKMTRGQSQVWAGFRASLVCLDIQMGKRQPKQQYQYYSSTLMLLFGVEYNGYTISKDYCGPVPSGLGIFM